MKVWIFHGNFANRKIIYYRFLFTMRPPEIIKTADGSDTLFIRELGEHYHSTFGAVQESMHVFINAGLRHVEQSELTIFEVGFGTGLNAWITLSEAFKTNQNIRYITVEKYPLSTELWSELNYPAVLPQYDPEYFRIIHQAEWNKEVKITNYFSILKLASDLIDVDYSALPLFNLIFFDAFSPDKQPELWETSVFREISGHSAQSAIIVTYCAKGAVRRSLTEVGFRAERIPGPPGKREMLRGTKNN